MDVRDPTAGDRSWVRWCRSSLRSCRRRGGQPQRALEALGKARARSGRHGELDRGHNADAGAPEGAEHSGADLLRRAIARRLGQSTEK
jgi:hypothetical protein